jgi:hypothetical protein
MTVGLLGAGSFALAHGFKKDFKTGVMSGYNEGAPGGPVSSVASGKFKAKIDDKAQQIEYTLQYQDLEGTVTQAHIHFGQAGVNGGIVVWLCETATNPSPVATTPTCPTTNPATVSGTLKASDVVASASQGIAAGEFGEVVKAIRAGRAYANVHSTKFPGGEIRAQLDRGHRFDD